MHRTNRTGNHLPAGNATHRHWLGSHSCTHLASRSCPSRSVRGLPVSNLDIHDFVRRSFLLFDLQYFSHRPSHHCFQLFPACGKDRMYLWSESSGHLARVTPRAGTSAFAKTNSSILITPAVRLIYNIIAGLIILFRLSIPEIVILVLDSSLKSSSASASSSQIKVHHDTFFRWKFSKTKVAQGTNRFTDPRRGLHYRNSRGVLKVIQIRRGYAHDSVAHKHKASTVV